MDKTDQKPTGKYTYLFQFPYIENVGMTPLLGPVNSFIYYIVDSF